MERREYTRFRVQDDAYAVLGGDYSKVGKVHDVSLNGLAFTYLEDKVSDDTFTQVDIFLSNNGFYLSGVPCTIVYEANESTSDANAGSSYRCGLKFESLEAEHEDKLAFLLKHHVIVEGLENRSQPPAHRGLPPGGKAEIRSQASPVKFSETNDERRGKRDKEQKTKEEGRQTKEQGIFSKNKVSKPVRHNFMIGLIDFFLLNVALFSVQLIKRGSFELSNLYMVLFAVFYVAWLAVALFMRKFRKIMGKTFFDSLVLIAKSNMAIVFIVSISIVLWAKLTFVSRMQTFGACGAFFLLELVGVFIFYILSGKKFFDKQRSGIKEKKTSSSTYLPLVYVDAALLIAVFMGINYIKRGSFSLPPRYDQMILILYGLLFVVSFIVKKYDKTNFNTTYTTAIGPCIKATLIMSAAVSVIVFSFRLFYYSRLHLYSTILILFGFEVMVYYVYYAYRKRGKLDQDIETADEVMAVIDMADQDRHLPEEKSILPVEDPVKIKVKHTLEFFSETLFDFITKNIDLSKIDRCHTAIMSTDDIKDIQNLKENRHCLLVNLHKTNDVRWFNRYFLNVYSKMKPRGYFIGKVHTITTRKKHYQDKYPKYIAKLIYYINFIWSRVCPKLPYIKKIYFTITRGRNRMVSKAEIFGRLYFCGFRIVDELEIKNRLFFVAQKVKKPSLNKNPSYGPIVRLKRTGYNGKIITVYKFRTMYPYSEFLQEYIYEKNSLKQGGKFKDDFRITDWGKYMRATWLDELPMLYNWLKGDLKLFGVRPLSKQYLSLYTKELQELRKNVVPGLVPPFYADLPETLPEIIESELRYIKSYLKEPLKTQARYTWRSYKNIIVNGARSH